MLDFTARKIIKDIALEHDLDPKLVEEAVLVQFRVTAEEMARGDLRTIMLPRLGKFAVNFKRVAKLNEYMAKKRGTVQGRKLHRNNKSGAQDD